MTALRIDRLESAADVEACARIMAASDPWLTLGRGYEPCLRALRDPDREQYIACRESAIAGFVILALHGPFAGYLQAICVAPEFRGTGAGSELITFVERHIFREHANVFLCVSSFNEGAQRLYARLGYEKIGELKDYLVAGYSEILMRKSRGPVIGYTPRQG